MRVVRLRVARPRPRGHSSTTEPRQETPVQVSEKQVSIEVWCQVSALAVNPGKCESYTQSYSMSPSCIENRVGRNEETSPALFPFSFTERQVEE